MPADGIDLSRVIFHPRDKRIILIPCVIKGRGCVARIVLKKSLSPSDLTGFDQVILDRYAMKISGVPFPEEKIRTPLFKNGKLNSQKPVFIAHRITSKDEARKALAAGAQMMEVDVQMTKDNVLVAYWGKVDTPGGEKCTYELTLEELEEITGELLKIEDLFILLQGKAAINLDLKDWSKRIPGYTDAVLTRINDLINKYGMVEDVYAATFNTEYMAQLKKMNPGITIGIGVHRNMDAAEILPYYIKKAQKIDASGIGLYPARVLW